MTPRSNSKVISTYTPQIMSTQNPRCVFTHGSPSTTLNMSKQHQITVEISKHKVTSRTIRATCKIGQDGESMVRDKEMDYRTCRLYYNNAGHSIWWAKTRLYLGKNTQDCQTQPSKSYKLHLHTNVVVLHASKGVSIPIGQWPFAPITSLKRAPPVFGDLTLSTPLKVCMGRLSARPSLVDFQNPQ